MELLRLDDPGDDPPVWPDALIPSTRSSDEAAAKQIMPRAFIAGTAVCFGVVVLTNVAETFRILPVMVGVYPTALGITLTSPAPFSGARCSRLDLLPAPIGFFVGVGQSRSK